MYFKTSEIDKKNWQNEQVSYAHFNVHFATLKNVLKSVRIRGPCKMLHNIQSLSATWWVG
jgi:hypothetical protein